MKLQHSSLSQECTSWIERQEEEWEFIRQRPLQSASPLTSGQVRLTQHAQVKETKVHLFDEGSSIVQRRLSRRLRFALAPHKFQCLLASVSRSGAV